MGFLGIIPTWSFVSQPCHEIKNPRCARLKPATLRSWIRIPREEIAGKKVNLSQTCHIQVTACPSCEEIGVKKEDLGLELIKELDQNEGNVGGPGAGEARESPRLGKVRKAEGRGWDSPLGRGGEPPLQVRSLP